MTSPDSGNTKVLWWLMGLVAVAFTALLGAAYQNLRADVNALKATSVTHHAHDELRALVTQMQQTQSNRNERGAIVDSLVSDIRTDIAGIKAELKDVREFLYRQYGGAPAKKPVAPPFPYSEY